MLYAFGFLSPSNHFICKTFNLSNFMFYKRPTVRQFLTMVMREAATCLSLDSDGNSNIFIEMYKSDIPICVYYSPPLETKHSFNKLVIIGNKNFSKFMYSHIALQLRNRFENDTITKFLPTDVKRDISNPPFRWLKLVKRWTKPNDVIREMNKTELAKHNLENTKKILSKTMTSLLDRGDSIDHLIEKSNDLSHSSKLFYKKTNAFHSCCIIS